MPDITRQTMLLREDLHTIIGRAEAEWPHGIPALIDCFNRSVLVDNGVAGAVLLMRSGATPGQMKAMARYRDAERKRRESRTGVEVHR